MKAAQDSFNTQLRMAMTTLTSSLSAYIIYPYSCYFTIIQ